MTLCGIHLFFHWLISNFSKKSSFWLQVTQTHQRNKLTSNQKGSSSRHRHLSSSPWICVTHRCDTKAQFMMARHSSDPEKYRFHQFCTIHPQKATDKIRDLHSANVVWQRLRAILASSWNHVFFGHPESPSSFHEQEHVLYYKCTVLACSIA